MYRQNNELSTHARKKVIDGKDKDFEYYNHSYTVCVNDDGGYDIISSEGKIGEVLVDGEERIVVIEEDKKEFVRNTKSTYYENLYKKELEKIRTRPYPKMTTNER